LRSFWLDTFDLESGGISQKLESLYFRRSSQDQPLAFVNDPPVPHVGTTIEKVLNTIGSVETGWAVVAVAGGSSDFQDSSVFFNSETSPVAPVGDLDSLDGGFFLCSFFSITFDSFHF